MEIKSGRDWVCPHCKSFNKNYVGNRCQVCEFEFIDENADDSEKKIVMHETPRKVMHETPRKVVSELPRKSVIETPRKAVIETPRKVSKKTPRKDAYKPPKKAPYRPSAVDKTKPTKASLGSEVDSHTDLFTESVSKAFNVFKRVMIACLMIALVIVAISVVSNASYDVILDECDNIFASVMETFESSHFVADEKGTDVFEPFYKIVERINSISQQLKDSAGREYLTEILGW